MAPDLGVCSWSLQPRNPRELVEAVRACGVSRVQLALDPIRRGEWSETETRTALDEAEIEIASGMMAMAGEDYSTLESIRETGGVRPTLHWSENRAAAYENAALAQRLGMGLVTFHAGFLPHDPAHPERAVMLGRLRELTQIFSGCGVDVALETGQESATVLLELLTDRDAPGCGVNFDPANMILYGMGDPVAALRLLGPWVRQMHAKDARPAVRAGEWGTETPVGEGAVAWRELLAARADVAPRAALVIEREAGSARIADVCAAATFLRTRFSEMRE